MKKLFVTLSVAALSLLNMTSSFAWGPVGHDVVAAIAEAHLNDKAKERLSELLDGRSLVYYSSWLDNVQNSPYWKDGYDQTKTWHYANVDKGNTYQTQPKNPAGDVVTAVTMLTDKLANDYENLTDSMRVDYVRMVVHLVGDMHCPMHAGRLTDLGGNRTKVRWFGRQTNLHSVWDSKIVESSRKWSYTEWREQIDRTSDEFKTEVCEGTYEEWFMGTVEAAAALYDEIESLGENPNLSYQYVFDHSALVEQQFLLGGYRLAHVLNSIFGN